MNGNNIAKWLGEMSDRSTLVREFNDAAKKIFSEGQTDVLLQASVSGGTFSPRSLRIKVMAGRSLTAQELRSIDEVRKIVGDVQCVRTLIVLGFSYVEIYDGLGSSAIRGDLLKLAGMSTCFRPEDKEQKERYNQTDDGNVGCMIAAIIIFIGSLILVVIANS